MHFIHVNSKNSDTAVELYNVIKGINKNKSVLRPIRHFNFTVILLHENSCGKLCYANAIILLVI